MVEWLIAEGLWTVLPKIVRCCVTSERRFSPGEGASPLADNTASGELSTACVDYDNNS